MRIPEEHQDHLARLNSRGMLQEKVETVHAALRHDFPFVDRVALALFDPRTRTLRSFLHSSGEDRPLDHYEAALADAPSLLDLLERGRPRVIHDLSLLEHGEHPHTSALRQQGYGSSYTLPYYLNGVFEAFVFFNSYRKHVFTPTALKALDVYGHLLGTLALTEIQALRTLLAALRTVNQMVHLRDPETGGHLERMAYYARLIARDLAEHGTYPFTDDAIEHLFAFAPLHDLGKIAIPDQVLLKPTALSAEERKTMCTHTTLGRQMVEAILENFGLDGLEHVDILKEAAEFHHEMMDGSGYPAGLMGEAIPIWARIIAVADVFDALTTRRPYKYAWTLDDAFVHLGRLAGEKLDQDCVAALVRKRQMVEGILRTFPESDGRE
jgi:HD-GYP domain-containing protein (c-di-GMP phosphodiesterase class II)